MVRARAIFLATALCMGTNLPAAAAEPVEQHNSNAVWFENWTGLSNASLTVVAPNGKISNIYAKSGTPVFQLPGDEVLDGVYRYELSAATDEKVEIVNEVDNGRGENQSNTISKPFYTTGRFIVSRGVIITPEETEEEDG
ncbi:hypothetical protein EI983_00275 (plasmid) [Roseovarius faecimaris]|uniref:Uncharacterized protein n=1 Tax=Roseovarius faecimaris TaxID=2494550 RepID=A0A6I6IJ12_9RHOB|nr:hypothetical protein [Roseovarius faecimaris]QGX96789.1 hypothetical protein EI983_00275 [Roseovarius faecimaris]